jgi:hypothetical protein
MSLPEIPLALHGAVFARHLERGVEDQVISAAAHAADDCLKIAKQVLDAHRTILADESLPAAARQLRAKAVAGRLLAQIGVQLDGATEKVSREIQKLRRESDAPPIASAAVQAAMDSEMRAVLRNSNAEQRSKLLAQGSDAVWRSLLNAPPELSGMSAAELEGRREQYRRKSHPAAAARLQRLEKTAHDLQTAADGVVAFSEKLFRPAKKYEQAAAAANQAAAT